MVPLFSQEESNNKYINSAISTILLKRKVITKLWSQFHNNFVYFTKKKFIQCGNFCFHFRHSHIYAHNKYKFNAFYFARKLQIKNRLAINIWLECSIRKSIWTLALRYEISLDSNWCLYILCICMFHFFYSSCPCWHFV